MEKCTSCNVSITNSSGTVKFKCPGCNQLEIVRCKSCRVGAVKYRCKNCTYEGPN